MYGEWHLILLSITLAIAFYTDLKHRIIPNAVTLPAIVAGIALNTFINGLPGTIDSLLGIFLGFVLFIIPFIIGGLGGGDVKLTMAIGAIMGMHFNLKSIVATVIVGAFISLLIMLNQGKMKQSIVNAGRYLISTILFKRLTEIGEKEVHTHFPYGIAITIGALITLLHNWRLG